MNELIKFLSNFTVEQIIIFLGAAGFVWVQYNKFKKLYQEKLIDEMEQKSLLSAVKKNSDEIEALKDRIEKNTEITRKYQIQSITDKIFVCYNAVIIQGYVTDRQYENFIANVNMFKLLVLEEHEEEKDELANHKVFVKYLPKVQELYKKSTQEEREDEKV